MKQITSLDYLRAFAITCIIIDHYIGGPLGRYLGETFICVFFGISSILFGMKWHNNNEPRYDFLQFMYPRLLRLSVAYYPFLIMTISLFIYLSIPVSKSKILMNLLFLPWFGKISGLGHLWFLTMILICYVVFILLSKFHTYITLKYSLIIVSLCLILQCGIQRIGLPGYVFFISLYCGLLFINAEKFLSFAKNLQPIKIIPIYFVINIIGLYFYYLGLFDYSHTLSKWVGTVCGFSNIILFINLFNDAKVHIIISLISALSYELYLVHMPLTMLKGYSINYTNSYYVSFILYILLSLLCALLLKKISDFLISFFKKQIKIIS